MASRRGGGYRWYAVALLFLVSAVNYMDRFVFAVVVEPINGAGPAAIGLVSDALRPRFGAGSIAPALGLAVLLLLPAALCFARAAKRLPTDIKPETFEEIVP